MATKEVRFGSSRIQIKKFNISEMVDHCTCAMIAKRASGKSYLTKELLFHKRRTPVMQMPMLQDTSQFIRAISVLVI